MMDLNRRTFDPERSFLIPDDLKECPQWISWRYVESGKGKLDKVPCSPSTGRPLSAQDPDNWLSFEDAVKAYERNQALSGIGFCLSENDPFIGVDMDHCYQDGALDEWANKHVTEFNSYTEISPSNEGLRIIVRGKIDKRHIKQAGQRELYTDNRFLTITGNSIGDTFDKLPERTEAVQNYLASMTEHKQKKVRDGGTQGPLRASGEEITKLLEKIQNSGKESAEYDDWLYTIGAVHESTGGNGREIALGWSSQSEKHDNDKFNKTWGSFTLGKEGNTDLNYLRRRAGLPPVGGNPAWPDAVDLFTNHPVPPFPIDILPECFCDLIEEKAGQSGFDPGGLAFGLFIAASNQIDHRAHLDIGPYKVPAYQWGGVVGDSGEGKSPIINIISKSADAIEKVTVEESKQKLARWLQSCEAAKNDKATPPPKPPWKQRHALDTTTEALALLLVDNPEGVNMFHHEITEFIGRMDAYTGKDGGKDRGVYLRSYDGGTVTINRVSKPVPLVVDNFSVGIVAGIQPEKLAQLFKKGGGGADGMYQRFLMYCLQPAGEVDYFAKSDPFTQINVDVVFRTIQSWNESQSLSATLSGEAKRLMQDYHNSLRGVASRTAAQRFGEHLNKFPGMLGRCAFALHIINAAAKQAPPEREVNANTMKQAIRFMKVMYRHSEAVYQILDQQAVEVRSLVLSAAEAILSKGWCNVKRGDLTRNATYWQGADNRNAESAIDYLIELGWLYDATPPTSPGKRGRRSSGYFLVNPIVHKKFNAQAERITVQRAERYKCLSQIAG